MIFLIAQKTFKVWPGALSTGGSSFHLLLFKPFSSAAGDVFFFTDCMYLVLGLCLGSMWRRHREVLAGFVLKLSERELNLRMWGQRTY